MVIDRKENLDEIFNLIQDICVKLDLRFGQLVHVIQHRLDCDDLFYIDNKLIIIALKKFKEENEK